MEGGPDDAMGIDENVPFVWKSGLATGVGLCDCPHRESTIEFRQADCRSLGFAPKVLKNKPGFRFVCCCGTPEAEICVSHPSQGREGWGHPNIGSYAAKLSGGGCGIEEKGLQRGSARSFRLDWI